MSKRVDQARALSEHIDSGLQQTSAKARGGRGLENAVTLRKLFAAYASQWNDADEAGDTEALSALQEVRPKLRLRPTKPSSVVKLWMYVRLLLTIVVTMAGCLVFIAVSPLRILHPPLRRCGVPNGLLPVDLCYYLWARAILAAVGIKVRLEGGSTWQRWGASPCGIVVYNHASNLDPFVICVVCRFLAPKFVGKKVLFKYPVFGWLCLATGMVPINRGDREKAVHTMNETVVRIMRRWGRSIAVSPEGTRTLDGHLLLPFKKGTFHLQEHTHAPMLPVAIFGAYELWPPGQPFALPGEVTVSVLPAQRYTEGGSRETSRVELQRLLAQEQAKQPELGARPLSLCASMENILVLLCSFAVFRQSWFLSLAAMEWAGLGAMGVLGLLGLASILVSLFVDHFI